MHLRKLICIMLLLAIVLVPFSGLGDLDAVFLNVGQGDSTLVMCDGDVMLIDGGTRRSSQYLYSVIRELGIERINYIIATHPDSDHIGGIPAALEAAEVDTIFTPVWYSEDASFLILVRKAAEKNLPFTFPITGESIRLGGATVTFLAPLRQYGSTNNLSIVTRIDYGDTSMLFTGDAEYEGEADMLAQGWNLDADLLHVGHHGSKTSTSPLFLRAVHPSVGIISVGKDNPYGLPAEETLNALKEAGVSVFRTDLHGLIIAHSDGNAISVETEHMASEDEIYSSPTGRTSERIIPQEESGSIVYIGNVKSMKFHYPTCAGVSSMSEKNKIIIHSRKEAVALGYEPCKQCQP